MSHDALSRAGGGHKTDPNAWFVGMAPRRNPDIVVAVLWEHGNWGNNSAKLAAQVINAFVNKQRKRDNNIHIADTPQPAKPEPGKPEPATPSSTTKPPTPTAE
jgi:penicillin-binding protein 2